MPDMLNPSFWVELYEDSDKIIMTSDEIRQFNERNFKALPFLFDFKVLPRMVEGEEVLKWINGLSTVPASARYDESGNRYQQKDYDKLKENLNKGKIAESMNVAYGFTVKRTQMRTWPSFKKSFPDAASRRIDYFTETAVYAAELFRFITSAPTDTGILPGFITTGDGYLRGTLPCVLRKNWKNT
ncbi:hypothetical protein [Thermoclostridium stercorarium]|uniref:hypothetical protein n=1 Tax=Thermoclostridium stercorarium TaxID=1510 RepID=UPI00209213E2|nr:hypothetical protein [Thermoclostridium stercorarium]